ncbi:MAG: N-acyl-D-amino acid deacylase, partial [Cyclobacteriaceae bacterium]|nr:N-acyl-D-amino acid deacylase [Cyclobacteriaceae bacterium]
MKRILFWIVFLGLGVSCSKETEYSNVDIYIKDAQIIDGTGAKQYRGEILIQGDSLLYVGVPLDKPIRAKNIIDAGGRVVSPGFIDPHAHGDPFATPLFENFIYQGVTTI